MKVFLVIAASAILGMQLAADANDSARAFVRWERKPGIASALHVATSGLFLTDDIAALG